MGRRACLAIGVGSVAQPVKGASRFSYLDGAVLAARSIADWALKSGFGEDNVRVIDDGSPTGVSRERVQATVNELFPPGAEVVDHLILAFCGHGLTDATVTQISWLFSDSLTNKYRVVADAFCRELLFHGVRRITLISDACREAPKDIDLLRLDASRAIVVHGSLVDSPKLDRLAACQDGNLGYMLFDPASAAPGKCIFSGVIVDVLWGHEPAAIVDGFITTASFARLVEKRTTERAKDYRIKLHPECSVHAEEAVLYDTRTPPLPPTLLQPWPPLGASTVLGVEPPLDPSASERARELIRTDTHFRDLILGARFGRVRRDTLIPGPRTFEIPSSSEGSLMDLVTLRQTKEEVPERESKVGALVRRLEAETAASQRQEEAKAVRMQMEQVGIPREANLVVASQGVHLWTRRGCRELPSEPGCSAYVVDIEVDGTPILVEFADGHATPVTLFPGLFTVVTRSETQEVFYAYGDHADATPYRRALKAMEDFAGGRLAVADMDRLAAQLRESKHVDPTLGAICAYLYAAMADFDSIRRMAYFYAEHHQPVPFDIALLGEMEVRERDQAKYLLVPAVAARSADTARSELPPYVTQPTPAVEVRIAGRCPWLGLGWDYVRDPRPPWASLVEGLADHATQARRGGFTSLPGDAARELARQWSLRRE